jgi:hypothetical protein
MTRPAGHITGRIIFGHPILWLFVRYGPAYSFVYCSLLSGTQDWRQAKGLALSRG